MSGKLGYRTPNDGGSAALEWRQQPPSGEHPFFRPTGFRQRRLRWDTGRAELITAKEQYQARSPGELALAPHRLLVARVRPAILGRGSPWARQRSQLRRPAASAEPEQIGLVLTFDRYETVAGVALPFRIKAQQNSNRFTLLIKDWQPGSGQ